MLNPVLKNHLKLTLSLGLFSTALFILSIINPPWFSSIFIFKSETLNHKITDASTAYVKLLPQNTQQSLFGLFTAAQNNNALNGLARILLALNFSTAAILTAKSIKETIMALLRLSNSPTLNARIFLPLIPFLGIEKEAKPWGIVYDSITKLPIDPAVVTIATHENGVGEFKQTRITDIQGRFTFLVTPGRYVITAQKTNYRFPSQIITTQTDGKFQNVYHGEVIEVENPYIINLNIPMDPLAFDWNQSIKPQAKNYLTELIKLKGRLFVIVGGFSLSIVSYALLPAALNLFLFFVYPFNLLFAKTNIQRKLWGVVYDKSTNQPVPRVLIKAINQRLKVTLANITTDHLGRYFLLLAQGIYTIQVEVPGKEGTLPKILAKIENVNVTKKKEVINFDIYV